MASLHWEPVGKVEVVRRVSGGLAKDDLALVDANTLQANSQDPAVLFLEAKKFKKSQNLNGTSALSAAFRIPQWLWITKDQDSNGYFYGRTLASRDQNSSKRHVSVFRFMIKYVTKVVPKKSRPIPDISYDWHILTFVTYWEQGGVARMLCFNSPPQLKQMIEQSLGEASTEVLLAHPFAFHAIVLEHVAELYDQAIWQFRDFVRDTEKQRMTIEDPQPDYTAMHELSRHVMHCTEVLSTALNVTDHMIEELARSETQASLQTASYDPGPDIRRGKSMLQFMENRSKAVEDRLKNEINLAFHITSQHANLISAQIAHAAQVDSRAMRTISILGLVFLPGTFISAIFSMSFFNFNPGSQDQPARWAVSDKFWLYWIVAIPVTALTVVVWWTWQKWGMPKTPEVKIGERRDAVRSRTPGGKGPDVELQAL
ncbi:hypothetical protein PRZ48_011916 [Zasmidium cellare]|uniref:Uncharacterized protein n=1 Tax=Zasmidium cellare TaxID=395010 RepID=A0ABR0E7P4_ZASCE|nr:hypothetical protein PRZ48_011916 [Zasmidium cellare]